MSSAPFTTACWALAIGCLVTILTAVPAALHPRRPLAQIVQPARVVADVKPAPVAPVRPASPFASPAPSVNPEAAPVRVAAADVNAPLGLVEPPPFVPQVSSPPITPAHSLVPPVLQETMSIPVPDPIERAPRSNNVFAAPASPPVAMAPVVAAAPPAPPRIFTTDDFLKLGSTLSKDDEQALRSYLGKQGINVVRHGQRSWTYRFEEAPVEIVLSLLATHAGRQVLISKPVSGRFTGTFSGMDPYEAFVLVIKNEQLRLDRRGESLLVLPPRDQLSAAR